MGVYLIDVTYIMYIYMQIYAAVYQNPWKILEMT